MKTKMSTGRFTTEYIPKRNRFSKSYGLVVFTKYPTLRVMIVERKIPYCLTNHLVNRAKKQPFIRNFNINNKNEKRLNISNMLSKSVIEWIRNFIKSFRFDESIQIKPSDIEDFVRYKRGKIFEDKYDFPHGQMTNRTKNYLWEKIGGKENIDKDEYYVNLVKKIAGFITAFVEFEEETGYTFRFDSDMVKNNVDEMILSFKGLDGYSYEQHFFIVTVDKIEKLNKIQISKNRTVATEIDREIYEAKFVDVEEAKKLFQNQEKEVNKTDLKYFLLSMDQKNLENYSINIDNCCVNDKRDNLDEQIFLDFIKHTEPGVYFRSKSCVRRRRWRDR